MSPRFTQGALRLLDRLAYHRGWRDARSEHAITGERGEEAAYFHLRTLGYTIVARNFRSPRCRGELDLVAWQGNTLCFIEVKARTARDFAPAESAVDPEKREDLRRIAREYLRHLPGVTTRLRSGRKVELPDTRFDLVSVYLLPGEDAQFEVQKAAFGW
ncbi:MAG: YraN family protein [Acidobacteriales bacterium]|nr:YraN family protein [Terriglobales bacterium]